MILYYGKGQSKENDGATIVDLNDGTVHAMGQALGYQGKTN
jgi:hypothetical protein